MSWHPYFFGLPPAVTARKVCKAVHGFFDFSHGIVMPDLLMLRNRPRRRLSEKLRPDVIVTGISMPQMDGIEAAKIILQKDLTSRVISLSVHNDPALVNLGLPSACVVMSSNPTQVRS